MRWILIAPLAVAALYAQTPAPEPEKAQAAEAKPEAAAPSGDLPAARKRLVERLRDDAKQFRQGLNVSPVNIAPKVKFVLTPGRPCAIPLKNVLPEAAAKADEKIVIAVPKDSPDRYAIKVISPPAPSCDDIER